MKKISTRRSRSAEARTARARVKGRKTALDWRRHRERLREYVARHPVPGISNEEVEAHFHFMPAHYWPAVDENELVWGLQTVREFLHGNMISAGGDTAVAIDSRPCPEQRGTKILVCTWDRVGLLARLAGYISALRLNIERAEAFTRADNIVLDVFWISPPAGQPVENERRIRDLEFLVRGGLSAAPPFVSTWAHESHKHVPRERNPAAVAVEFSNTESAEHTIIRVRAPDRLGLLHDILQALFEAGVNVAEANIRTVGDVAEDVFCVTDAGKGKVTGTARLGAIRTALMQAAM